MNNLEFGERDEEGGEYYNEALMEKRFKNLAYIGKLINGKNKKECDREKKILGIKF